jgi:hypothetical protein
MNEEDELTRWYVAEPFSQSCYTSAQGGSGRTDKGKAEESELDECHVSQSLFFTPHALVHFIKPSGWVWRCKGVVASLAASTYAATRWASSIYENFN